jgi:hypothetical protein
MAAKPNPEMDERVSIPLDPETALRELLKVAPDDPQSGQSADADPASADGADQG